jgi:hypothetical protein
VDDPFTPADDPFTPADDPFTQIGKLGNRFGELAEHLVTPNIAGKFRALGYAFTRTGSDVELLNRDGTPLTEVDLWLENGEFVMAVEVKSRLRREYVDDHLKRMAMLRSYFDERGDTRKLLGAAAGAIVPQDLKQYVRCTDRWSFAASKVRPAFKQYGTAAKLRCNVLRTLHPH